MSKFLTFFSLAMVVAVVSTASVQAEFVVFEFASAAAMANNQAGMNLNGLSNGTSTVNGTGFSVTLTASANQGSFNFTSTSPNFGIDSPGTLGAGEIGDGFDTLGNGVPDIATFSFTTSAPATINFVSIDLDRLTEDGEVGSLDVGDGSPLSLTPDNDLGSGVFSVDRAISPGQQITLSHVSGGGFGLEAITLDVVLTAVPEPTSLLLFGSLMTGFGLRRKRRLR